MKCLLAILSILLLVSRLSLGSISVICIASLALVILKRISKETRPLHLILFGVLIPILPIWGIGGLSAVSIILLLIERDKIEFSATKWAIPFLIVACFSVIAEVVFEFDLNTVLSIYSLQSLESINDLHLWFQNSPPHYFDSLRSLIRYALIPLLYSLFVSIESERVFFYRGLAIGSLASVTLAILQSTMPDLFILHGNADYWNTLGRVPGGFTDPNAFGLFIALFIPFLLFYERSDNLALKYLQWFVVAFIVLASFLSGSRSLLIGLSILIVILIWRYNKRLLIPLLISFAVFLIGINLWDFLSKESLSSVLTEVPTSISRTAKSFILTELDNSISSRAVFFQISLATWLDNLVVGVGFEQFRGVIPIYAQKVGIDMGGWSDNANNFYLSILSELGIVGFLALLFGLSLLRIRNKLEIDKGAFISATLLVLLLFLGPHLDFEEISILTAFVLASLFDPIDIIFVRFRYCLIIIFLVLAICFRELGKDHGFYPYERDVSGEFRWTGRIASATLNCNETSTGFVSITAANPDLSRLPVEVIITIDSEEVSRLLFSAPGMQKVTLPCPQITDIQSRLGKKREVRYRLVVSRVWIPRKFGLGADLRPLGVRVSSS